MAFLFFYTYEAEGSENEENLDFNILENLVVLFNLRSLSVPDMV